jgi:hypothetical protein
MLISEVLRPLGGAVGAESPRSNSWGELDDALARAFGEAPHTVRHYENGILRLERVEGGSLLGWFSKTPVVDFLRTLDPVLLQAEISVTRKSGVEPKVSSAQIRKPNSLSPDQAEGIHLVRLDTKGDVALVWESVGDGYSDIAVLSGSWAESERYLVPFIPTASLSGVTGDLPALTRTL